MKNSEPATKKTTKSVFKFIDKIKDDSKRKDAKTIIHLIRDVTGEKPVLWTNSIIGFGSYTYKYASGREGEWMAVGFSPRRQYMTIYIMPGYLEMDDLLKKLGPHKKGRSCLYIKALDDINLSTLKKIIRRGYSHMKKNKFRFDHSNSKSK